VSQPAASRTPTDLRRPADADLLIAEMRALRTSVAELHSLLHRVLDRQHETAGELAALRADLDAHRAVVGQAVRAAVAAASER
jgi:peptidoglycan hydrolase CwlO-like protein